MSLKSLDEDFDTTASTGERPYLIVGALIDYERRLVKEWTRHGLHAARMTGRVARDRKAVHVSGGNLEEKV